MVVLYDGFSKYPNYTYNKSGLYFSLENFKNELVLGGDDIDDAVYFVVEYEDPEVSRRSPTLYSYSQDGTLYNLGSQATTVSKIDDGNKNDRSGASGLIIYNGKMYFFSSDDIGVYDFSDSSIDNSWGSTQDKSLNEWNGPNNSWHIPYVYNGIMYFCNGNYLGYYD